MDEFWKHEVNTMTRREFVRAVGASAVSFSCADRLGAQMPAAGGGRPRTRLPRGYLIVQDLGTYNTSRFGAISTAAEAEDVFDRMAGKLDALEFGSLYYGDHDMRAHEAVARVGVAHHVDLWTSTFRFKFRAFGDIRPEFQAHVMEPDGRIVPAEHHLEGGKPERMFDVLNPEAMDWLLGEYQKKYLDRMKGLLSGVFFNEDCLPYLGKCVNNRRFDYWRSATFSPRVFSLWRDYCREHDVVCDGRLVDKFPVHDPAMVARGNGLTGYFRGWNVPAVLEAGQRFTALPRAEGVWQHWYDFTCGLFLKNWIGRLAHLAHEVNRRESLWKGVMYFGLHYWSLPYEQITNPQFQVPATHKWGAWGRQRGVDLQKVAAHPDVDIVICETYPPMAAHLEYFVAEFARLTREAGKTLGVMLHRDDKWALKLEEEQRRWDVIARYQPTVIARYPRQRMVPGDPFYNPEAEKYFTDCLGEFRRSGA